MGKDSILLNLFSDKVRVISEHNDDKQYFWEIGAGISFTVQKDENRCIARSSAAPRLFANVC